MKNLDTNHGQYVEWNAKKWLAYYKNETGAIVIDHEGKTVRCAGKIEYSGRNLDYRFSNVILTRKKHQFVVSPNISSMIEANYNASVSFWGNSQQNEQLLRLCKWHEEGQKLIMTVQPCMYSDMRKTALMLDGRCAGGKSLREYLGNEKLEELRVSQLANIIGISGLVITSDGQLILQIRAENLMSWPGALGCSFGGGLKSEDLPSDNSTLSHSNILRECTEELGILPEEILRTSVRFLGIDRDYVLAGSPSLMFIMTTTLTASEVRMRKVTAKDTAESTDLIMVKLGATTNSGDPFAYDKDDVLERLFPTILQNSNRLSTTVVASISEWIMAMALRQKGK